MPVRRAQQRSILEGNREKTQRHFAMLRKFGRKTGRQAVLRNLQNQSKVREDSMGLVGSKCAANEGDVQSIREEHFSSRKKLELARKVGIRWKKKATKVKLRPLNSN